MAIKTVKHKQPCGRRLSVITKGHTRAERLAEVRRYVLSSKEVARQFLMETGIVDEHGQLTPAYQ